MFEHGWAAIIACFLSAAAGLSNRAPALESPAHGPFAGLNLLQAGASRELANSDVQLALKERAAALGPLLIHIPKTAGTAIEDVANKSGIHWGRFVSGGRQQLMFQGMSWCSQHHVPPSMRHEVDLNTWEADDAFCVVRHPYDRIVSEYSYRLSVLGVPKYFLEKNVCKPEGLNFFVQHALLAYVSGKPFAFDCHLLPQHVFVEDKGKTMCGHVLKLEDLPGAFNELMQAKGLDVSMPDKKSFSFDSRCRFLSVEDLWPETRRMIDAAYAEDFERFGFEPSSGAAQRSPDAASSRADMSAEEAVSAAASQAASAVKAASGMQDVELEAAHAVRAFGM